MPVRMLSESGGGGLSGLKEWSEPNYKCEHNLSLPGFDIQAAALYYNVFV